MIFHAKLSRFFFIATLLFFTVAPGDSYKKYYRMSSDVSVQDSNKKIEAFSIKFFKNYMSTSTDKNVIVSPSSIWTMMSMLYKGARGRTRSELENNLGCERSDNAFRANYIWRDKAMESKGSDIDTSSTNFLIVDYLTSIYTTYLEDLKAIFKASFVKVNFKSLSAADKINEEVVRATKGKISSIVESDNLRDSSMILANALYFNGKWRIPFNTSSTKKTTFYDFQNNPIGEVNMMFQNGHFAYFNCKEIKAHIVELPYGQTENLSMIIVVPYFKIHVSEVLNAMLNFTLENIMDELASLDLEEEDGVDVYLPRFSIENDIILNPILQKMGILRVFEKYQADLGHISYNKRLYLSLARQKALVEVSEEGTTSTAVTIGELANRSSPPLIKCNKPFLFFICEKSRKMMLFSGYYGNPTIY